MHVLNEDLSVQLIASSSSLCNILFSCNQFLSGFFLNDCNYRSERTVRNLSWCKHIPGVTNIQHTDS